MAERVVVGVGNGMRGDDAAGLAVIDALVAAGCHRRLVRSDGNPTQLLGFDAADVVVVDAVAGGKAGAVHRWDARAGPLPAGRLRSTHAVGLGAAVELGRALGTLPERLTVIGITGGDFSLGAPLTPEVEQSVAAVARELADA